MTEEKIKDINLYKNIKKFLKHIYTSIKKNDSHNFTICLSNLQNINKNMVKSSSIYLTGGDLSIQNEILKNKIIDKIKSMKGGLGKEIYELKDKIIQQIEEMKIGVHGFDVKKILEYLTQINEYITQLGKIKTELMAAKLAAQAKLKLSPEELSKLHAELIGIGTTELDTLRMELNKFKANIENIVDPKNPLEAYTSMETACKNYHSETNFTIPPPSTSQTQSQSLVLSRNIGTPVSNA